jgi:dipeptidyl aminopeptidase/acylaminoacyl peptidase
MASLLAVVAYSRHVAVDRPHRPEEPMPLTGLCPSRRVRIRALLIHALLLAFPLSANAQTQSFTLDDVIDLRNASVADVSDDGRWVLITSGSLRDRIGTDNARSGDPTYVGPAVTDVTLIDTQTGQSRRIFPDKRQIRGVRFSPDGNRIAMLIRDGEWFRLAIWERASGRLRTLELPPNRIIAENTTPQWTEDGARLLVALRDAAWLRSTKERFNHEVKGPIVVQSSRNDFLSWEEIRRLSLRQSVAMYDLQSNRFQEVLPEGVIGSYGMSADGRFIRWNADNTKKTNYAEISGSESSLKMRPIAGGEEKTLFPSTRSLNLQWSGDGRSYVYVKDNRVFYAALEGGEPRPLTAEIPRDTTAPVDSATRAQRNRERFTPVRLSHDGRTLIASNREGLWFIETATGTRERFHDTPQPADSTAPRWAVIAWTRDANRVYLSYASRTSWDRGVYAYDRATKQQKQLLRDDRFYSGFTLSNDGKTIVLQIAEGNQPGDVYVTDADLANPRRITDSNPALREKKLGKTRLIEYLDADGDKLYGVLYLPSDYADGKRVPTIFLVYESFFDDRFNSTIAYLNANGYAVIQPSVNFETGYPGEAWLKGVTAAANKLIDMGIADPDKLGIQGTSYGGYATNLLITQTKRFKAAINISGKTDMISFYTDSPRLGTRNIHAPERSQDRLGATLWEQPHKYIEHSAVMAADRITTPLLLMTGHEDSNVPERTTMEMFYALRRLGKVEVEWVSYINGGHGMPTSTIEEVIDYHKRILGWYDRHLKGIKSEKATAESGN